MITWFYMTDEAFALKGNDKAAQLPKQKQHWVVLYCSHAIRKLCSSLLSVKNFYFEQKVFRNCLFKINTTI